MKSMNYKHGDEEEISIMNTNILNEVSPKIVYSNLKDLGIITLANICALSWIRKYSSIDSIRTRLYIVSYMKKDCSF